MDKTDKIIAAMHYMDVAMRLIKSGVELSQEIGNVLAAAQHEGREITDAEMAAIRAKLDGEEDRTAQILEGRQ